MLGKLFHSLMVVAALLMMLPSMTNAGMDDTHVVTKLTGKVWIRAAKLKYGTPGPKWYKNPQFASWRPLKKGEVVSSVAEVKTDAGSTVWLQTGDAVVNPAALPRDSYTAYFIVEPKSAVRCNSQYDTRKIALMQKMYGTMRVVKVYGKAPVQLPSGEHQHQ